MDSDSTPTTAVINCPSCREPMHMIPGAYALAPCSTCMARTATYMAGAGIATSSKPVRRGCKSHCCIVHGCKYRHKDCPVVMREEQQDHLCEQCNSMLEDGPALVRELRDVRDLRTKLAGGNCPYSDVHHPTCRCQGEEGPR
jgi:LSD1 subclass zinc finger protein